ncbi:hypothetical protein [Nocardioides sp.]|nr:hypothetical protein [Nocardioides sp.]
MCVNANDVLIEIQYARICHCDIHTVAYEGVLASDVRYRFVIDTSSLG